MNNSHTDPWGQPVFRVEGSDYVVSTETFDTTSLAWAVPRIVDFIDGISPIRTA